MGTGTHGRPQAWAKGRTCPPLENVPGQIRFIFGSHQSTKIVTTSHVYRDGVEMACAVDQRRLEVRGVGTGPAVPVDLHDGLSGRYVRHHSAGADNIRRQEVGDDRLS